MMEAGGRNKAKTKDAKGKAGSAVNTDFKPSRTKRQLINRLIKRVETGLHQTKDPKGTVGDLVRLLQLEDELTVKKPKEIKVRWVEPANEESVSET